MTVLRPAADSRGSSGSCRRRPLHLWKRPSPSRRSDIIRAPAGSNARRPRQPTMSPRWRQETTTPAALPYPRRSRSRAARAEAGPPEPGSAPASASRLAPIEPARPGCRYAPAAPLPTTAAASRAAGRRRRLCRPDGTPTPPRHRRRTLPGSTAGPAPPPPATGAGRNGCRQRRPAPPRPRPQSGRVFTGCSSPRSARKAVLPRPGRTCVSDIPRALTLGQPAGRAD